jgi:hypothetical protein
LAENIIATDPEHSYYYAKNVLKGQFEAGEKIILSSGYKEDYESIFPNK